MNHGSSSATRLSLFALLLVCATRLAAAAPAPQPAESDPDLEAAQRIERAFKKLAKRVEPCVVSLKVRLRAGVWPEELRRMAEMNASMPEEEFDGAGVLVDPAGFIMTNEHLVRDARKILATLSDGRVFRAEIRGTDTRSDLAMLKLAGEDAPKELPAAELADSDTLEVGQWVLAVGNPFGQANSFTVGVVSALKRHVRAPGFLNDVFYGGLIQTDAWINPGNSGGPLFDLRGKLIGINTMIYSQTGRHQGCGFAIPSNHLKPRLAYLKNGLEIEYGWLGLILEDLQPGQEAFKTPDNKGVRVGGVIPNTPADRAGLEPGMIILNYDGARVADSSGLIAAVNETPVGRTVKLKVLNRQGQPAEFSVRVSKRFAEIVEVMRTARQHLAQDEKARPIDPLDDDQLAGVAETKPAGERSSGTDFNKTFVWRGLLVREREAGAPSKSGGRIEIVRVKKGSPADRAGLYEGATITELKHAGNAAIQKINSLEDFKRITSQITGEAALLIPLDGYVTIEAK